jgi:ElaB/YqjD/DUF883 family membrane-anchored ribosome-binding protein
MISDATRASANMTKNSAEHDLKDQMKDVQKEGKHMIDNAADYAHDAGAKLRDFADKASDNVTGVARNVESEIKSSPVRATLYALGAGFILGALLTRR